MVRPSGVGELPAKIDTHQKTTLQPQPAPDIPVAWAEGRYDTNVTSQRTGAAAMRNYIFYDKIFLVLLIFTPRGGILTSLGSILCSAD